MSQHTPHRRRPRSKSHNSLPRGATKLHALGAAIELAGAIHGLELPRGLGHLRDHLTRAADNTALRLAEASGRTLGNRRQHLEAAYAENQEVQCDLLLLRGRRVDVPDATLRLADRLGGMVYGLLRVETRSR
jgi:hypothetical protein